MIFCTFISLDVNVPFLMTKNEINKTYGIKLSDIPVYKLNILPFYNDYDVNLYQFDKSFRLMLNKRRGGNFRDIITDEFKLQNNINIDPGNIQQNLTKPFADAIKYSFINRNNKNYIIPGIYYLKTEIKYKIFYHMLINVHYQNKITKFVVVLEHQHNNKLYNVYKILRYDMGLCNARYVTLCYLHREHIIRETTQICLYIG